MTRISSPIRGPLDAAVVDLVGPDARRFCNSMFTNNARDLAVGDSQQSAMTDDRGRMQGLMTLRCIDEAHFMAVLEGSSIEEFIDRYRLFIVFDDLEMEARPEARVFTVQGCDAADLAGFDCWPARRSTSGGFDVLSESSPQVGREAEPEELEALRIEAGVPRWPVDASAKQLPHELGLRETHLHFEKGCYRGQEIIHRVDVMGQVRKGLMGLRLIEPAPVGTDVMLGDKRVGRLGASAIHPDLGRIGLAVVRKDIAVGTNLTAGGPATLSALPFEA